MALLCSAELEFCSFRVCLTRPAMMEIKDALIGISIADLEYPIWIHCGPCGDLCCAKQGEWGIVRRWCHPICKRGLTLEGPDACTTPLWIRSVQLWLRPERFACTSVQCAGESRHAARWAAAAGLRFLLETAGFQDAHIYAALCLPPLSAFPLLPPR